MTELNILRLSHKGALKTFPLYQSCLHLGQTLLCLFSWVFHKPQGPPCPANLRGLVLASQPRTYLPSFWSTDSAQKSADLGGQNGKKKTKTLQGNSLIIPPPVHTFTHTHTYTDTHTQTLNCKHFPFFVPSLFHFF